MAAYAHILIVESIDNKIRDVEQFEDLSAFTCLGQLNIPKYNNLNDSLTRFFNKKTSWSR